MREPAPTPPSLAHLPGAGPFAKWISLITAWGDKEAPREAYDGPGLSVRPPHPPGGKTKETIRDGLLGAIREESGQEAALMGDTNCDPRWGCMSLGPG